MTIPRGNYYPKLLLKSFNKNLIKLQIAYVNHEKRATENDNNNIYRI